MVYCKCRRAHTHKRYGNDIQLRAVKLAEESPTAPQSPASHCVRKIERTIGRPAKQGAIVFCDRFFDANGNQVQDMQVAPDPYPATVLMANAMNTSAALTEFLRQGDIPRFLNQELIGSCKGRPSDPSPSSVEALELT